MTLAPPSVPSVSRRVRSGLTSVPLVTTLLFVVLAAVLGNRLALNTNDEGIILDAAQRMALGQKLYVDFFGYMSPGSYWIQEIVFRLFGISMFAGHIPVLLDAALQCGLALCFARLFMEEKAARACFLFFTALRCYDLTQLTAQHRMDSASLCMLALYCAIRAGKSRRPSWFWGAGALIAAAAFCTPSLALVALVMAGWAAGQRDTRPLLIHFLGGAAILGFSALALLWLRGSGPAFIEQMLWLQKHYSNVNRMAYGSIIGGYRAFLWGGGGAEAPVRAVIAFWLAVPAMAPILALCGGGFLYRKLDPEELPGAVLLWASAFALVLSAYPRLDVAHLGYVLAVPFVLAFALIQRVPSKTLHAVLVVILTLGATTFLYFDIAQLLGDRALDTPVGRLRVARSDWEGTHALLTTVRPGQSLYVHPYSPLFYFLTQARNPTRFSYLAPGMMTSTEEHAALNALLARPPQWVLYLRVEPREYLRIFPSADPRHVTFPSIENWIAQGFAKTALRPVSDYTLLQPRAVNITAN